MKYEGSVYRPPSEAYSLIIQVTIGCAHNDCTFCSMFKDKAFRIRGEQEVFADLEEARSTYKRIDRIFLADGDALVLSNSSLTRILDKIRELFPEVGRVSVYGSPQDVLRKSDDELADLREHGVEIIYIGAESGNDEVLRRIKKGANRLEIIEAVKKIEAAAIKASVTFISGLGGQELWHEHAVDTGTMISEMGATYVGLLTLMVDPVTEIYEDIQSGKFKLLSPTDVAEETYTMLENINLDKPCIFRSNHASNYVALKGTLPQDKDMMLKQLQSALSGESRLKDEKFRML